MPVLISALNTCLRMARQQTVAALRAVRGEDQIAWF